MTNSQPKESKKRSLDFLRFVIWISLAIFLRWQALEPRWIPSGSMLPTLEIQDRILVEKIIPKFNRILNSHVKKESIVVFSPPAQLIDAGYDPKAALIKRVVGLPGDQIEVANGKLIRNNITIEEPWITEPMNYESGEITVPMGCIWVLGDNRNNSLDSHLWGALPEENLIGTAVFRYWPLENFGLIRFPSQKELRLKTTLR